MRIPLRSTRAGAAGLAGVLLTALLVPSATELNAKPKWAHALADGGKAVAHHADGRKVNGRGLDVPRAVLYDTTLDAGEPTVGVQEDGTVFFVGADIDGQVPNQVDIVRSDDDGKDWELISPRTGPAKNHPVTLDPYIWIDEYTQRLYTIDLTVACSIMSYTDDDGESWTTNPIACGRPVNDHQTLFGGPPATSTTVGYDSVLYYCWNDIATSSCGKSIDGGLTWRPTGTPAFAGFATGEQEGGFCGGLHGHGVVGPDGTVFLPREYCGIPYVAISHDEGLTWETVQISKLRAPSGSDPSVAVDRKGNVYYTWTGPKRQIYVSYSRDGGERWSKAINATPPGVIETNLPTMDAGAAGKIALAYYGSTNSPGKPWDAAGYASTTWNVYATTSANLFSKNPVFYSASLNHPKNPVHRQRCGPGRCGRVFDFIDVEIGPDGTPWVPFVDTCTEEPFQPGVDGDCVIAPLGNNDDRGLMGRLVGGPRLT